jgi:hypothetical protein
MELQLAHADWSRERAEWAGWPMRTGAERCAKLGQSDRDRSWAGPKPTAAMTVGPSQKGPRSQRASLVSFVALIRVVLLCEIIYIKVSQTS